MAPERMDSTRAFTSAVASGNKSRRTASANLGLRGQVDATTFVVHDDLPQLGSHRFVAAMDRNRNQVWSEVS